MLPPAVELAVVGDEVGCTDTVGAAVGAWVVGAALVGASGDGGTLVVGD